MDDWTRLDRFLILGAEGGTYYIGERELPNDRGMLDVVGFDTSAPAVIADFVRNS